MNRIILHIDFDYFYAQLEELRKPELKGKPLAVCMFSGRTEFSGAVATANYPARELGVHAGMPIALAKSKSKDLVLLPADREYYMQASDRIMEMLREDADKFEQVSVDEAYLDISQKTEGSFIEARKIAKEIKKKIFNEEHLTCSVGIGPNKLIAKMACGVKKPNGLTAISALEVSDFLRSRRISDLHGIGEKTVEALAQNGIKTIPQLAASNVAEIQEMFGQNRGRIIHEKARGVDESAVEEKEKQQYSRIATLKENTQNAKMLAAESQKLASDLAEKVKNGKIFFKTVSIILISNKLESITRSRTLAAPTQNIDEITKTCTELFDEFFAQNPQFVARRFGLRVSNFSLPEKQRKLFEFGLKK